MLTIRNSRLFEELKAVPHWETLFADNEGHTKDPRIPFFAGKLDHIEVKQRGVYFYDSGCNSQDNSFVIRPEL